MRNRIFLVIILLQCLALNAQDVIDIKTVQQDISLVGQTVTVNGVVTVSQGVFQPKIAFIQDSKGGAYSGIAIFDSDTKYNLKVGDEVKITGKVYEERDMTGIYIDTCLVVSENNPLPPVEVVKTSDLSTDSQIAKSYEGVLVQVNDVIIFDDNLGYGEWSIDDGTGACRVDDGAGCLFYDVPDKGTKLASISGIFKYSYGNYKIDPRYRSDIIEIKNEIITNIYSLNQDNSLVGKDISVSGIVIIDANTFKTGEVILSDNKGGPWSTINLSDDLVSLQLNLGDQVQIEGKIKIVNNTTEILVKKYKIINKNNPNPNELIVSTGKVSSNRFKKELYNGVICKFFDVEVTKNLDNDIIILDDGSGKCKVDFNQLLVPSVGTQFISITGILNYDKDENKLKIRNSSDINENKIPTVGDTLTIIQRPILNVPTIVKVGEILSIECQADPDISSWKAELSQNSHRIPLKIKATKYNNETFLWNISAKIPDVPVYDLYDLTVSASNGIFDITKNSVKIISDFKDDYYFVHITDPHLPTHKYYFESDAYTDSSSLVDLREVINDINIINPEFVLLTGDLINEGELEDFQYRRYFSRSKRLLGEFDVPLFLTSGNHDLGGWSSTPPPDGTARKLWWKFFGWKSLYKPQQGNPYYTQNYSFDYGPVHYVGLEAYKNYDRWQKEIYGKNSFTSGQLEWLKSDLESASGSAGQVLFYHFDFNSELDLNSLGVEMALWGHTHRDAGDINSGVPYSISTRSSCDGNRSYRLIRVSGSTFKPSQTISAGKNGDNLNVKFEPANNGLNNTVTALIENSFDEQFEDAILRFQMPLTDKEVKVTDGEVLQIDKSGSSAVYYVKVNIQPQSKKMVTITFTD